jgi:toxin ParE1/3/4
VGVRKLVTRRYPYLVYYTVDEASEEIVIITIQHPARDREHSDT